MCICLLISVTKCNKNIYNYDLVWVEKEGKTETTHSHTQGLPLLFCARPQEVLIYRACWLIMRGSNCCDPKKWRERKSSSSRVGLLAFLLLGTDWELMMKVLGSSFKVYNNNVWLFQKNMIWTLFGASRSSDREGQWSPPKSIFRAIIKRTLLDRYVWDCKTKVAVSRDNLLCYDQFDRFLPPKSNALWSL